MNRNDVSSPDAIDAEVDATHTSILGDKTKRMNRSTFESLEVAVGCVASWIMLMAVV